MAKNIQEEISFHRSAQKTHHSSSECVQESNQHHQRRLVVTFLYRPGMMLGEESQSWDMDIYWDNSTLSV
jgi:hypothetical protein